MYTGRLPLLKIIFACVLLPMAMAGSLMSCQSEPEAGSKVQSEFDLIPLEVTDAGGQHRYLVEEFMLIKGEYLNRQKKFESLKELAYERDYDGIAKIADKLVSVPSLLYQRFYYEERLRWARHTQEEASSHSLDRIIILNAIIGVQYGQEYLMLINDLASDLVWQTAYLEAELHPRSEDSGDYRAPLNKVPRQDLIWVVARLVTNQVLRQLPALKPH